MNTFLPYANFAESARVLDYRRLGKQRVETLQILRTLGGQSSGWSNHPAVHMWKGYENSLKIYGILICLEWQHRGYQDTCLDKIQELAMNPDTPYEQPPWLGDPAFHSSHRAALLCKNYQWYSQFGWTEKPEINYCWPIVGEQK